MPEQVPLIYARRYDDLQASLVFDVGRCGWLRPSDRHANRLSFTPLHCSCTPKGRAQPTGGIALGFCASLHVCSLPKPEYITCTDSTSFKSVTAACGTTPGGFPHQSMTACKDEAGTGDTTLQLSRATVLWQASQAASKTYTGQSKRSYASS
jgi:hypothetical protein